MEAQAGYCRTGKAASASRADVGQGQGQGQGQGEGEGEGEGEGQGAVRRLTRSKKPPGEPGGGVLSNSSARLKAGHP